MVGLIKKDAIYQEGGKRFYYAWFWGDNEETSPWLSSAPGTNNTNAMQNCTKWEADHTAQQGNNQGEPLPQEIQQSIVAIQSRFEHISCLDIVAALYRNLVSNQTQRQETTHSFPPKKLYGEQKEQQPDPTLKTESTHKMTFTIVTKEVKIKEVKPKEVKVKAEVKQFHQLQAEADADQDYDDTSSKAPSRERAKRRYDFSEYTHINRINLQVAESWDTSLNLEHRIYCYKVTPTFEKEAEQLKYYQKRDAAIAYLAQGHGFVESKTIPQDQNSIVTDKKKHKLAVAAFINDTLRKFEYFLVTECSLKLRPITGPEMKALFPFFLSPQESLSEDEYLIFRRFTKVTFEIGSASIYERAAQLLYIKMQILLQGKVVLVRGREEKRRKERQEGKEGKEGKEKVGRRRKKGGKEPSDEVSLSVGESLWGELQQQHSEYDPYPQLDDLFF